jgi:carboxyl-terminal processing protease
MSPDERSTLMISSDGKRRRVVRIQPRTDSIPSFLLEASQRSTRVLEVAEHKVGYFHLWAGTHERFLNALDASLATFEDAGVDALLIDLRGGFGGAGLEYLAGIRESAVLRQVPKYFLVDDGVRSGKEWVAATIKLERLGTLIGSRTAGAFLAGKPFRFASGKYLLFLAVDAFAPPGIPPIEGVGVEPNVPVPPCRTYCAGRDPQLDKSLELIEDELERDR